MTVSAFNPETGRWEPAVPLPWLGVFSVKCSCGKRFLGGDRRAKYERHYRGTHMPPHPDDSEVAA